MWQLSTRCCECAVTKHVHGRLKGRKCVGEKSAQAPAINITLRGLWNQNPVKNVEHIHEEWNAALSQRFRSYHAQTYPGLAQQLNVEPLLNQRCQRYFKSKILEEEWRFTALELCELGKINPQNEYSLFRAWMGYHVVWKEQLFFA